MHQNQHDINIAGVIVYSDATFQGKNKFHMCMEAAITVAMLPNLKIPKHLKDTADDWNLRAVKIFHKSIDIVYEPLYQALYSGIFA